MIDPADYQLVASMVANGMTPGQVADELDETVADVRDAATAGAKQRTWND